MIVHVSFPLNADADDDRQFFECSFSSSSSGDIDTSSAHIASMRLCNDERYHDHNDHLMACPVTVQKNYAPGAFANNGQFPNAVLVYTSGATLNSLMPEIIRDMRSTLGLEFNAAVSEVTAVDRTLYANIITFSVLAHFVRCGYKIMVVDDHMSVGYPSASSLSVANDNAKSDPSSNRRRYDLIRVDSCVIENSGNVTMVLTLSHTNIASAFDSLLAFDKNVTDYVDSDAPVDLDERYFYETASEFVCVPTGAQCVPQRAVFPISTSATLEQQRVLLLTDFDRRSIADGHRGYTPATLQACADHWSIGFGWDIAESKPSQATSVAMSTQQQHKSQAKDPNSQQIYFAAVRFRHCDRFDTIVPVATIARSVVSKEIPQGSPEMQLMEDRVLGLLGTCDLWSDVRIVDIQAGSVRGHDGSGTGGGANGDHPLKARLMHASKLARTGANAGSAVDRDVAQQHKQKQRHPQHRREGCDPMADPSSHHGGQSQSLTQSVQILEHVKCRSETNIGGDSDIDQTLQVALQVEIERNSEDANDFDPFAEDVQPSTALPGQKIQRVPRETVTAAVTANENKKPKRTVNQSAIAANKKKRSGK